MMGRRKSRPKKGHPILICFCLVFIVVMTYGLIQITPIIQGGYTLYEEATKDVALDVLIEQIQEDDTYLTLEEIPLSYQEKLIESEDRRFYTHGGIDLYATLRAVGVNLREGSFKEGGSTITQQLAKNLYFSFEKKIERKVAELLVAIDLEKLLTKEEILELYCNVVYFGEGCYGVQEAAWHYYGVDVESLTASQIDALVFTVKSPNNYNPNVYEGIL